MKIIILGATGFLGSWTVRAAVAAGHEVIAVFKSSSDTWRLEGVTEPTRVAVDVGSGVAGWADAVRQHSADVLISLDWQGVDASQRDDELLQMANLERQTHLVAAASDSGVRMVLGVGSQAEYGPIDGPMRESQPTAPNTAYGRAKVAASEALQRRATESGLGWAWARVFSVYGPLEGDGTLISSIADAVAERRRIALGPGLHGWSYLHAADAATALLTLAVGHGVCGIYNVAHPDDPPLRESALIYAKNLGGAEFLGFGESRSRQSAHRLAADTTRLSNLGWRPRVDRESGLASTARWMTHLPESDLFDPSRELPRRRPTMPS